MSESLLDLHLDQVEDPTTVPGGEEYQLRIVSAQMKKSNDQTRDMLLVGLQIVDHPASKSVFENLILPKEGDKEQTVYLSKLRIKHFMQAFGIDPANPGDPSDWVDKTAWGVLKLEEYNGEVNNKVSKWSVKK